MLISLDVSIFSAAVCANLHKVFPYGFIVVFLKYMTKMVFIRVGVCGNIVKTDFLGVDWL